MRARRGVAADAVGPVVASAVSAANAMGAIKPVYLLDMRLKKGAAMRCRIWQTSRRRFGARMAPRDLFRVATFNVRRFTDRSKQDASAAVVGALRQLPQPLSLLALTEVDVGLRPRALSEVGDALGLPHCSFFGHAFDGRYGNALLSAMPIASESGVHLDGGSILEFRGARKRIARGLLLASTVLRSVAAREGGGGEPSSLPVRVGVTHWDHISEAERAVQAAHTLRALGPPAEQHCLLLGDLNALDASDYTPDEWAAHVAHNASRGWGAPVDSAAAGGCLDALRSAGFADCARLALHDGAQWTAPPWTAHAHSPASPRYRIDYVQARGPAGGASLEPLSAAVGIASSDEASDHSPVAVEFGLRVARAAGRL
jgi:endonuclease/exonuclease/phosphatase family metal-dependent hydrolase